MEEGLFSKVANRVSTKTKNCKIIKKIACLGVAVGLTFNLSACNWFNHNVDKIDSSTTSSSSASIDDDGYTGEPCIYCNGKHASEDHNKKADMSKYSDLVKFLTSDERYIIPIGEMGMAKCRSFRDMPYGFLEDLGYDVEQVKKQVYIDPERESGNSPYRKNPTTETWSFFKDSEPNNLYMIVWVNDEATQIIDVYQVRYKLTDIEKRDYVWLQSYKLKFFANDAVSRLKKPEILSHTQQLAEGKTSVPIFSSESVILKTAKKRNDCSYLRTIVTELEVKKSSTSPTKKEFIYQGMILNGNYIFYVNSEDNATYLSYSLENNYIFNDIHSSFILSESERLAMEKLKKQSAKFYYSFTELRDGSYYYYNRDYKNFIANVDAPFELENNK